jgi:acyl-CoA thioester hydrolase
VSKRSEFTLRRRVQFYETDAAGIVHFSCYFRYLEEAEHALWRAAGLSIAASGAEHGWPRVAVSCDYRNPLRFEDECDIRIRIVAMSSKTLRYACAISLGTTEIATLAMTIVCTTKDATGALRAATIPEAVRDRLGASSE